VRVFSVRDAPPKGRVCSLDGFLTERAQGGASPEHVVVVLDDLRTMFTIGVICQSRFEKAFLGPNSPCGDALQKPPALFVSSSICTINFSLEDGEVYSILCPTPIAVFGGLSPDAQIEIPV